MDVNPLVGVEIRLLKLFNMAPRAVRQHLSFSESSVVQYI